MRVLMLLTLTLLAGPAAARPATLESTLAGRVAGAPVDCIDLPRVQGSSSFSDPDSIVYRMSGKLLYLNQPAGGCGLRGDPVLVTRTPSTRLCRGDIVNAIDRGSRIPVGSCGLGPFVPYTKAK
jgi:hypothetical protein